LTPALKQNPVKILGLDFFPGTARDAIREITQGGGLLTAPAAPGLAHNLNQDPYYREALLHSRILLPDSGLMVLVWNQIRPKDTPPLYRVSGLEFLKEVLLSEENRSMLQSSFWIMPNELEAKLNRAWLLQNTGVTLPESSIYVAPDYPKAGPMEDPNLLAILKEHTPGLILNNIGGGTQERLGHYLQNNLSPTPAILCCGAAIAFLTGGQTCIPPWADKYKLGWLLRCVSKPTSYIPRYWKAKAIVPLMYKYKGQLPPITTQT
jgi:UDP-N-acetyl-D-mannosaminuronic acid transferase (WecB/TagA/CpsF family)